MSPGSQPFLMLSAVSFAVAAVLLPLILPVGRRLGLMRANFRGDAIPTAAGWVVIAAVGIGFGIADRGLRIADWGPDRDVGRGLAVAALLYGVLGLLDDRFGDRAVKGLRGHVRALFRDGRVTTGLMKATGGVLFGLVLAATNPAVRLLEPPAMRVALTLLGGALIALSANAVNLLDLRPLRAIKGFGLSLLLVFLLALLLAPSRWGELAWLGLPLGALMAYVPLEARCRAMLGDTGANALGAMAGFAAVTVLPADAQLALVAALAALHLFAERRSITAAIAAHPLLDRFDRCGWGGPGGDVGGADKGTRG